MPTKRGRKPLYGEPLVRCSCSLTVEQAAWLARQPNQSETVRTLVEQAMAGEAERQEEAIEIAAMSEWYEEAAKEYAKNVAQAA